MTKSIVEIELENREKLSRVISRGLKACTDLRVPFGLIARDQMRRQQSIFALQGAGKYQDLADSTKKSKKRMYGKVYPILFAKGRLSRSLLYPGGENVLEIGKRFMIYGTKVDYGIYHQSEKPRKKLPRRPFLFVDEVRVRVWSNIIKAHIGSALTGSK